MQRKQEHLPFKKTIKIMVHFKGDLTIDLNKAFQHNDITINPFRATGLF